MLQKEKTKFITNQKCIFALKLILNRLVVFVSSDVLAHRNGKNWASSLPPGYSFDWMKKIHAMLYYICVSVLSVSNKRPMPPLGILAW